ncbi:MAG: DUF2784 domain-containing protein [Deltaproteobacteria bacterium]|nr:DUF2784 domain-containing protein [Deltaproteobacteria bacterium]
MIYRILADIVILIHFGFIIFVVFGGLLLFHRSWFAFFHLPAVCWGGFIEVTGRICPLTPLENKFRSLGLQQAYQGGFVEHYLIPLIYPDFLNRKHQYFLAVILILINFLIYGFWIYKKRGK